MQNLHTTPQTLRTGKRMIPVVSGHYAGFAEHPAEIARFGAGRRPDSEGLQVARPVQCKGL